MKRNINDVFKKYQNYIYQFHCKRNVFVEALKVSWRTLGFLENFRGPQFKYRCPRGKTDYDKTRNDY
jgi:hypothetical protein